LALLGLTTCSLFGKSYTGSPGALTISFDSRLVDYLINPAV
jgi:hypothetical protein